MASLATAWLRPGVFGSAVLLSGSFVTALGGPLNRGAPFQPVIEFVKTFTAKPGRPVDRMSVAVGIFEGLLEDNRALVPVLESTGADVAYEEVVDGHHWQSWRNSLARRSGICSPIDNEAGPARVPVAGVSWGRSTRHIGLSLGADLCWPQFYEDILAEMSPVVEIDGETVDFDVERITIEPFDLDQSVKYDVVLDRLTPWYHTSREWIKKAVVKDDLYVLNNPFTLQAMQKHTSYAALMRLGARSRRPGCYPPRSTGGPTPRGRPRRYPRPVRPDVRPARPRRPHRLPVVHEAV